MGTFNFGLLSLTILARKTRFNFKFVFQSVECFIKAVNITSIKFQQQAGRRNVKQTWNLIYSALLALENETKSSLMRQIQRKCNMHMQV